MVSGMNLSMMRFTAPSDNPEQRRPRNCLLILPKCGSSEVCLCALLVFFFLSLSNKLLFPLFLHDLFKGTFTFSRIYYMYKEGESVPA